MIANNINPAFPTHPGEIIKDSSFGFRLQAV